MVELRNYGKWAFISGGSEGIGAEFARRFAEQGVNLVLAARRQKPLDSITAELSAAFPGVMVRTLNLDLTAPDAVARIVAATCDLEVGIVVSNAGAGDGLGEFVDLDMAIHRHFIALNVIFQVEQMHHFGGLMKQRGRGALILISSLSGLAGQPRLVTYGATKGFMMSLAEGLWLEMKPHGVDVLGFAVSRTATPRYMQTRTGSFEGIQEPSDVVDEALAMLGSGPCHVPRQHRLTEHLLRTLPRDEAVEFNVARGRSANNA